MAENPWEQRMLPHHPRHDDRRGAFDLDYARVVHSQAFRRLAGITQILAITDSDFSRNRLTHTIEVGQVALGIIQTLAHKLHPEQAAILPSRPLIEAISAVHDIGHGPGAHGGEVVLNWVMRDHGGFEGNGQTLRILTKLMNACSQRHGANLTRRTLLGTLKYPIPWSEAITAPAHEHLKRDRVSPLTGRPLIVEEWYTPPKCFLDIKHARRFLASRTALECRTRPGPQPTAQVD